MTLQRIDHANVGDTLWSGELENGLAIRIVSRPGFKKKLAMFAVNYGGAMRSFTLDGRAVSTPAGVAHFLEHKMFDLPDGNALSMLTARGAEANAYTSGDMTAYHFECGEGFYDNLELLLKFVGTPYFTPESVLKEQGIIGQEIRMTEDDPNYMLYISTMRALFERHPVRDGVAGTVESIAEITPETLYDCYRAFYVPSNMALCVSGDVDPERVAEMAGRLTEPGRRSAARPDYGPPEALEPVFARVETVMDVADPLFCATAKLSTDLPRGAGTQRLIVTGELTARCLFGAGSEFYTSLYADGLLRGNFYRDVSPLAGTLLFECGGSSAEPEKVFERFCSTLRRAAETGVDPSELERARRAHYGAELRGLEDPDGLCGSLAHSVFEGVDPYDLFTLPGEITSEDCASFVREYLDPERFVLSTVRPKA